MATFVWPYDANTVSVVGSWSNWEKHHALSKQKGVWQTTINDLNAGNHQYKFVVDGRRWCYDIMKPTKADDQGNRNNVLVIGRGQSAPPPSGGEEKKPQQQKKEQSQQQESKKEQQQESKKEQQQESKKEQQQESKKEQQQESKKEQQQQRKEKGQQQQQQQKKEKGGKGGVSAASRAGAQKIISAVKSYGAPWFVADVEIDDTSKLDDVLGVAKLFSEALPDSACLFLFGGKDEFIAAAAVPDSKAGDFSALEFVNTALSVVPNPPPAQGTANLAHASVAADPDKSIFPLKLKDLSRGPTFQVLRKRGLVKEDESDDDEPLPSFDDL